MIWWNSRRIDGLPPIPDRVFHRSVDLTPLGVLFLIGGLLPKPFIDRVGTRRILNAESCQAFQLLATPTTTRSSPSAFVQLTGGSNPVDTKVVENFSP
jgi:hypothetical protein